MDMDMDMSGTPPNINEWATQALLGVMAGVLCLLVVRHALLRLASSSPPWSRRLAPLLRLDRAIVNRCSYQVTTFLPPVGGLLVAVVMVSTLLPLLLVATDLQLNSNRAGFLTVSLVPFLLGSTGKYSALQLLTGMSARQLNWFHRFLGYCMIILATVHMACMITVWARFPAFLTSQLQATKVQYGLAGYGCLCVVILGSLYPVRVYKYEIFLGTHLCAFGFLGAISVHTPYAMRYFLVGLLCYVLNVLASWFVQNRMAHARVHVLNGATRLRLRTASPIQHHPGQHVYLCIPRLSCFQWHPFTICNISANDTLIEVYATVRGDFTRALYNAAASDSKQDDDENDWLVMVMGPVGRHWATTTPEHMLTHQHTIVLANGGAGVTFGIRLLRNLMETLQNNEKIGIRTHTIYFSWSARHAREFSWFRAELQQHQADLAAMRHASDRVPALEILFHYTGDADDTAAIESGIVDAAIADNAVDESLTREKSDLISSEERTLSATPLRVVQNRINPADYLSHLDANASLGLFVCGPPGFNRAFKNKVAALGNSKSSQVTLYCEDFE
ncbi:hypothetical protein BC940DRAFT_290921 [Gongronella butleri]|nr:hypothetical protein BC940DRAFT_290921 [Gongronella butleri]